MCRLIFNNSVGGDNMTIEVGKVYKCGKNYVKILFKSEEHLERGFYNYIGVISDRSGTVMSCDLGMFAECYGTMQAFLQNPEELRHDLEEAESTDSRKIRELKEQYAALGQKIKELEDE